MAGAFSCLRSWRSLIDKGHRIVCIAQRDAADIRKRGKNTIVYPAVFCPGIGLHGNRKRPGRKAECRQRHRCAVCAELPKRRAEDISLCVLCQYRKLALVNQGSIVLTYPVASHGGSHARDSGWGRCWSSTRRYFVSYSQTSRFGTGIYSGASHLNL